LGFVYNGFVRDEKSVHTIILYHRIIDSKSAKPCLHQA